MQRYVCAKDVFPIIACSIIDLRPARPFHKGSPDQRRRPQNQNDGRFSEQAPAGTLLYSADADVTFVSVRSFGCTVNSWSNGVPVSGRTAKTIS